MCTVIVEVPSQTGAPVRLLAVRDEDPARPWDSVDAWWPKLPGVVGVRDRQAGGAWLAANDHRFAVVLNRAPDGEYVPPASPTASRGMLPLQVVDGSWEPQLDHLAHTGTFNLVTVDEGGVHVHMWNGTELAQHTLTPGVHMIAHHNINDDASTRIHHWLPRFRELAGLPDETWQAKWMAALDETASCDPDDDRAIIRNNQPHGFPTQSLVLCLAEIAADHVTIDAATLPEELTTNLAPTWPADFTHTTLEA